MSDLPMRTGEPLAPYGHGPAATNLADILERVLDTGIVIAGDIKINLLDIELLTIRLRLFVSSVDTAKKAGIDWWETDPALSTRAARDELSEENRQLRERIEVLEGHRTEETREPVAAKQSRGEAR
ncbi:gas vesicle protein [Streptomyces sp. HNM0574]|uniref:gas vesicle protein n=1 Tax=Streptomyces sp. HNM0574 TaxID=2714954 RepID=UPI00146B41B2|nr:gas vesicle protein [Streptomyces sp. HNM0574]NLU70722.1 gas vesicle protein [Streptomyces sp. HNM0574]